MVNDPRHGPTGEPASEPDDAPERSLREKLAFLLLGLLAGLAAVWFKRAVLMPWVAGLAAAPPSHRVWGLPASVVLSHGLFVGLPLLASVLSLGLVWRGGRILRTGQVPPPGERVFRRTPIRRGAWARWVGYAHLVPTLLLLGLALWGWGQAEAWSRGLASATP
jgi:hypothetical protein